MKKQEIELIGPDYNEWEGSRRGPCHCWHGTGCEARATYRAEDGKEYVVMYTREFPFGTQYGVGLNGEIIAEFRSLKEAAKSPHLAALRALHAFAVSQKA